MKFNQKLESKPKMSESETLMKIKNLVGDYVRVPIDDVTFKQWLETLVNNTSMSSKDFANRLFGKIYLDTFTVLFNQDRNNQKWFDSDLETKINNINLLVFSQVSTMTEDKKFWFLCWFLESFSIYWKSIWGPLGSNLRSQNYKLKISRWDLLTSTLSKSYWRWTAMLLFWCINKDNSVGNEFSKFWFSIDFPVKTPRQLSQIWLYYKSYLEYFFYNIFDDSKLSSSIINEMKNSMLLPKSTIAIQPFKDISNIYSFANMLYTNWVLNDTIMRDRGIFELIKKFKWVSSLSKIKLYKKFLWKKTP